MVPGPAEYACSRELIVAAGAEAESPHWKNLQCATPSAEHAFTVLVEGCGYQLIGFVALRVSFRGSAGNDSSIEF